MGRVGNFSYGTIKFLAEAADYCCARCYRKTSYFCTEHRKRIGYGRAAHIVAASSGGPRADEEYTVEQLKAADNGVHLCANCADLVDKAAAQYSVEHLKELQRQAEERVRNAVTGIGSSLLMSFDQSQRVSLFMRKSREVISEIDINRWHGGWAGRWKWVESEKAMSFYRECQNINSLHNKYNGGIASVINLQSLIVANIYNMCTLVKKNPWRYNSNSYEAEYVLSAEWYLLGGQRNNVDAAGEMFSVLLKNTYELINHLQTFTVSGESPINQFQFRS